jgi:hypothetical protein
MLRCRYETLNRTVLGFVWKQDYRKWRRTLSDLSVRRWLICILCGDGQKDSSKLWGAIAVLWKRLGTGTRAGFAALRSAARRLGGSAARRRASLRQARELTWTTPPCDVGHYTETLISAAVLFERLIKNIWYSVTITILDIIHRPIFYLRTWRFGDWILSPSSGGKYSDEPDRKS